MFDDRIGLFHGRNIGPFAAIFQYFYDRFFMTYDLLFKKSRSLLINPSFYDRTTMQKHLVPENNMRIGWTSNY